MSNLDVSRFLLEKGLKWAEGCVFLDENDRQMILMRKGWEVIPLQRVAAMPLTKRFTFYDQVHTTGMDIKQAAASQAAITLGKDMCLRDYAQGAWRMRSVMVFPTCQYPSPRSYLDWRGEWSKSRVFWML